MRLILVRHAEAANVGEGGVRTDADRPLTPDGERMAAKLSDALRRLGVVPDAVVCSPLLRARQTADPLLALLASGDRTVVICDELSADSHRPEAVFDAVNALGAGTVIAVGHLPDIAVIASLLVGAGGHGLTFDKGTAACVECHPRAAEGIGVLEWLVTPEWYAA